MKRSIPTDIATVPPSMILVDDFVQMVELYIEDITRSIRNTVDNASASPRRSKFGFSHS